jgi:hypothetical protein
MLRDFTQVCSQLGVAVEVDAARFGSRAHRLRNFWVNIGEPGAIAAAVQQAARPANLLV